MDTVLLQIATFAAAFAQAITGVGFGMIAGPVVLVVLDDPAAVLISSAMSWLISLVLWPMLYRGTDVAMLKRLLVGAVPGALIGLAAFAMMDVATLKLVAGLAIGALTCMMLFGAPGTTTPGRGGDMSFGGFGGFLGASLSMPGPPAALRMGGLGYDKRTVRATMVTFFVCVWPFLVAGQALAIGLTSETLWNAASLVPATLAGILGGNWAAARVSEAFFRRLVFGFLILTSLSLLGNAVWQGMGGML